MLNASVTPVSATEAEVQACIFGDNVVVSDATGKPVPGILGSTGQERVEAVMQLTTSGWKLAGQTVTEGTCAAS